MRSLIVLCVVVCVVLAAGFASAANPGQVSQDTLSKMGLADLQPMSDVQGTSVRGSGFAAVGGYSFATSGGGVPVFGTNASSGNGYIAVSGPRNNALAAGGSVSVSASGVGIFLPNFVAGAVVGSVSGGGAIAYAR